MFMRYLKVQGFVLLCGGLVGPIFLATFCALGRDPILKWMFWTGLLVTAADVLIALLLTNNSAKSAATSQFLEHQGVLALAQVTAISETGTRINDQPLVKINLHIEGPGLTPIDGQDRVIASVTRLPMITGRKLVVLVDPATIPTRSIGREALWSAEWFRHSSRSTRTTGPTTCPGRPAL